MHRPSAAWRVGRLAGGDDALEERARCRWRRSKMMEATRFGEIGVAHDDVSECDVRDEEATRRRRL